MDPQPSPSDSPAPRRRRRAGAAYDGATVPPPLAAREEAAGPAADAAPMRAVPQGGPPPAAEADGRGLKAAFRDREHTLPRERLDRLEDLIHCLGRLADGKSADRVAWQIKFRDALHVVDTEINERRALVDAEQHLTGIDGVGQRVQTLQLRLGSLQPAIGALAGLLRVVVRRGIFHTLVERHRDIGAEIRLDAHALLRAHKDAPSVDVRRERDALLADLAQSRK